MTAELETGFVLGPYRVEPLRGAVTGPEGTSHHLEPKVMSVFVHLATHANSPVTRKQLLDEVWPGQFAADELLTRAISELRRVLDDSRADPTFIETIPKVGYCLVGQVSALDQENSQFTDANDGEGGPVASQPVKQVQKLVIVVAVVAAVASVWFFAQRDQGVPTPVESSSAAIAVFPFNDRSQESSYIGLGRTISERILHRLVLTRAARILSTDFVFALIEQGLDEPAIAREMGATHTLTGSYEVVGAMLNWTARLTDQKTAAVIWSGQGTERLERVQWIDAEIAKSVAESVGGSGLRADSIAQTINPEAIRLYGDAREAIRQYRFPDAIEMLENAVEQEPTYVDAKAQLAQLLVVQSWLEVAPDGLYARDGHRYALDVLQIDPNNIPARAALSLLSSNRRQWDDAQSHLNWMQDNASTGPADWLVATTLVNLGYGNEAVEHALRMYGEDNYGRGINLLFMYYMSMGRIEDSLEAARRAEDVNVAVDGFRLGVILAKGGEIDAAIAQFERQASIYGYDAELAPLFANAIATGEVPQELRDALQEVRDRGGSDQANLLYFYVTLGYPEEDVFDLAEELASKNRLNHIALFPRYPKSYLTSQRFSDLMEEIGLVKFWRTHEMPDFCEMQQDRLVCQ